MIIQKTKVRSMFNKSKIQVSKEAMDMLNREFETRVEWMIENVKWSNVKRLKPETFWSIYKRLK
jgi:hypothetical protein